MRYFVLLLVCITVGCSRTTPSTNATGQGGATNDAAAPRITIVSGAVPDDQQQAKMLAAKDALFEKLSGRLMEAMGEGGPAAAILVCQKEAPQIASTVGQEQGVSIGRTGVRLRNPNNQAPQWAAELVEQKIDKPTFVMLSDNKAAALLPIKLQVQCLMCHGPDEQISPDVKTQLQKSYPADQATGFNEGDLRGWFWITSDQVE
jgi:hypothetical protein